MAEKPHNQQGKLVHIDSSTASQFQRLEKESAWGAMKSSFGCSESGGSNPASDDFKRTRRAKTSLLEDTDLIGFLPIGFYIIVSMLKNEKRHV